MQERLAVDKHPSARVAFGAAVVIAVMVWAVISLESLVLVAAGLIALVLVVAFVALAARRSAIPGIVVLGLALLDNPLAALAGGGTAAQVVGYLDDASLALLFAMVGFRAPVAKAVPRLAWVGLGAFAATGIAGALVSGVSTEALPLGAWLALKLPLTIHVMTRLIWTSRSVRVLIGFVLSVFAINLAASMIELVQPQVIRSIFGATRGETARLGIASLQGVFAHPVQAATFLLFVMVVFLGAPVARKMRWVGYVAAGLGVLGLRAKTIVDVFVVLALRIMFQRGVVTRALTPILIVVMGAAILTVSADLLFSRVAAVLESDTSARALLLDTANEISRHYFPLGGGFGTFGSEASRAIYSPLWREYGLSSLWGFQPGAAQFATDASWATVLGESGVLGAIGFALAMVAIWTSQFRTARLRGERSWSLAALMFTSVVILDSLASPRLFDGFSAAGLGVLLALAAQEQHRLDRFVGDLTHPWTVSGKAVRRRA